MTKEELQTEITAKEKDLVRLVASHYQFMTRSGTRESLGSFSVSKLFDSIDNRVSKARKELDDLKQQKDILV